MALIFSKSTILLTLGFFVKKSNSIATSISIQGTVNSYIPLTSFEALMLCLVLFQISVLQLTGVIPFDLSKVLHGNFSGMGFKKTDGGKRRRKRNSRNASLANNSTDIFKNEGCSAYLIIVDSIKKVDHFECMPRTLCEVQDLTKFGANGVPEALKSIIDGLLYISELERQRIEEEKLKIVFEEANEYKVSTSQKLKNSSITTTSIIAPYEEAIFWGQWLFSSEKNYSSTNTNKISDTCESIYPKCPMTTPEIFDFINMIQLDDFL